MPAKDIGPLFTIFFKIWFENDLFYNSKISSGVVSDLDRKVDFDLFDSGTAHGVHGADYRHGVPADHTPGKALAEGAPGPTEGLLPRDEIDPYDLIEGEDPRFLSPFNGMSYDKGNIFFSVSASSPTWES